MSENPKSVVCNARVRNFSHIYVCICMHMYVSVRICTYLHVFARKPYELSEYHACTSYTPSWFSWHQNWCRYRHFRHPTPDDVVVEELTTMGKALLVTLKRTFPFKMTVGKIKERSMWCNEKVHSILHAPRTIIRMGRSQNVFCQVTELRHKGVKRKGSRTNRNPGTACLSIMNQKLRESACQRMAQDLDTCGAFYAP